MTGRDAATWLDRYARHLAWWAEHHPDPIKRARFAYLLTLLPKETKP